jgi:hypothetical protein
MSLQMTVESLTKRSAAATYPLALELPSAIMAARMAMVMVCPTAAKSNRGRRPRRSIRGKGMKVQSQYARPLKP